MQKITNEHTKRLSELGLTLQEGWSEAVAEQLVLRSTEEEIRSFTPRDASERFVSLESAQRWYEKKEHIVYTLWDKTGAIGGLFWFSYEPKYGADYTIGIRVYASLRGKGLAGELLEACQTDFHVSHQGATRLWLETDTTNRRARALYAKHGYVELHSDAGRTAMVYSYV